MAVAVSYPLEADQPVPIQLRQRPPQIPCDLGIVRVQLVSRFQVFPRRFELIEGEVAAAHGVVGQGPDDGVSVVEARTDGV